MQTYWLMGKIKSEQLKLLPKEMLVPQPLFALREGDKRRRSPKLDSTTRRGSLAVRADPTVSKLVGGEQTPPQPNGSIPGIPVFLRVAQDSPRPARRFSAQINQTNRHPPRHRDLPSTQNKLMHEEYGFTPLMNQDMGVQEQEDSSIIDDDVLCDDADDDCVTALISRGLNGEVTTSSNRRHRSGGDARINERPLRASPLESDDSSCRFFGDNMERKLRIDLSTQSKRWRSCDEIDIPKVPKATLKDWLAGLFNNTKLQTEGDPRKLNNHPAPTMIISTNGDEESIV